MVFVNKKMWHYDSARNGHFIMILYISSHEDDLIFVWDEVWVKST